MTTLYESYGNGFVLNIFRIIISIDPFSNSDYFLWELGLSSILSH